MCNVFQLPGVYMCVCEGEEMVHSGAFVENTAMNIFPESKESD
jgi:hypothetical protein